MSADEDFLIEFSCCPQLEASFTWGCDVRVLGADQGDENGDN